MKSRNSLRFLQLDYSIEKFGTSWTHKYNQQQVKQKMTSRG